MTEEIEVAMLSTEDYQKITQLYARYCQAGDKSDPESWASVFTEDAFFDGSVKLHGRDEIREFARNRPASLAAEGWRRRQHWNSNLVIADSDNFTASGRCYFLIVAEPVDGGPPQFLRFGTYQDELVRSGADWFFQRRTSR